MSTVSWPPGVVQPRASPQQTVEGTQPVPLFRVSEVYEEAYSRIGIELREAYQILDASRSLRLLFQEWSNRGINLWAVVHEEIPIDAGQSVVDTPLDTVDILAAFIRYSVDTEDQMDYFLDRWSTDEYDKQAQKNLRERPLRYWMDRAPRFPKIVLWPIPDTMYVLFYTRLRSLRSPATGLTGELDVPDRMIPAVCAGLAYLLAQKNKESLPLVPQLKAEYDRQWVISQQDDREKSDLMIVPQDAWSL